MHMAEGLYKTTGQVAAVLGNPGPGSANLPPGVITARHEGVPVLIITAQHRLGIVHPSTPSRRSGRQDQLDVFRPMVKWGGPIFERSRIPGVDGARVPRDVVRTSRPGAARDPGAGHVCDRGRQRWSRSVPPPASRGAACGLRGAVARQPPSFRARRIVPRRRGQRASTVPAQCRAPRSSSSGSMPGRHDDGGPCGRSRRSTTRTACTATDRAADAGAARSRRRLRARLAARQPRFPLRQVLGPYPARNADPHRRRSAPHRASTRPVTIGIVADLASAAARVGDALRARSASQPRGTGETGARMRRSEQAVGATRASRPSPAWAGRHPPGAAMQVVGETLRAATRCT